MDLFNDINSDSSSDDEEVQVTQDVLGQPTNIVGDDIKFDLLP